MNHKEGKWARQILDSRNDEGMCLCVEGRKKLTDNGRL